MVLKKDVMNTCIDSTNINKHNSELKKNKF